MSLSKRQLYDYRDPSRAELTLTRAIHHLWFLRRKLACTGEQYPLNQALDTLFEAKRQVKAEQKAKRAEAFKNWVRP